MAELGFDKESEIYSKLEFFNNLLLKDSRTFGADFNKILSDDKFKINKPGYQYNIGFCVGGSHGLNNIYNQDELLKINSIHKSFISKKSKINKDNNDMFQNWKKKDIDLIVKSFDCDLHLFIDDHTLDGKGVDLIDIYENMETVALKITDVVNKFMTEVVIHLNNVYKKYFMNTRANDAYFFNLDQEVRKFGYRIDTNDDFIQSQKAISIKRKQYDSLGEINSTSNIFGRIFYNLIQLDVTGKDTKTVHSVMLYDIAWERSFKIYPYEKFQANNVMKYHNSHQIKYYFNNLTESIKMFSFYDIIKNYISLVEQPKYRKRHKAILRIYYILNILKNKKLLTNEIKKELKDDPAYKKDIIIILEKLKFIMNKDSLAEDKVRTLNTFKEAYNHIYNSVPGNYSLHFNLPACVPDNPAHPNNQDCFQTIINEFKKYYFRIDENGDDYTIDYGEKDGTSLQFERIGETIDNIISGIKDESLLELYVHNDYSIEKCEKKFKEFLDDKYKINNIPESNKKNISPGLIKKYKDNIFELDNIVNIFSRSEYEIDPKFNKVTLTDICNDILNRINENLYKSPNNDYFIVYCPISYSINSSKNFGYLKNLSIVDEIYYHPGFIYGTTDYNSFIERLDRYHDIAILLVNSKDRFYLETNEIILPVGTNFFVLEHNYLKYKKNLTHVVFGIVQQQEILGLDDFFTYYSENFNIKTDINKDIINPLEKIDDYILSNLSPFNNIFRTKEITIDDGIYGLYIPENTKLFSTNGTAFSTRSTFILYNNDCEEYIAKKDSFFINIESLLKHEKTKTILTYFITTHIIDYISCPNTIKFLDNGPSINKEKVKYIFDTHNVYSNLLNFVNNDEKISIVLKAIKDLNLKISGLYMPSYFEIYKLDESMDLTIAPAFLYTNDKFFDKIFEVTNKTYITENIILEISKYNSLSPLDMLYKSLGISNLLKMTNTEKLYKDIYLYCNKHNTTIREFFAKYQKYKLKYYKLKNKLNNLKNVNVIL